ncbi:high light inducible protein [Cyanobium sp. Alchichica 3B3-8F6]|uniref:high light inducible protein n=1 Tax=Cyanobium sp. Alchichica 3B3-8F6 TaxID=2823696 RepID=UPI0020CE08D1|nr:high light inducible protein [Cyanobium sp. Alchichica 3B3-8F6]MCP9882483.1 high light inducible protein [Cyanobium sp. Alchichica 3B3-8F6]
MTPLDSECDPHAVVEHDVERVTPTELNAWRRGFTPQAEIWNGRLAMLGLSVGLSVLLVARLASH